ncbi:MAG: UvrB/UvrC motif-containing protein, partial [Bdellovibrionales bacterium]|nr:UvrB/UvrC motif-containing protein [Bdellovibrionales bacterium]
GLAELYGFDLLADISQESARSGRSGSVSNKSSKSVKIAQSRSKVASPVKKYDLDAKGLMKETERLRVQMKKAARDLEFEEAARIRDEIKRLELRSLMMQEGEVDSESQKAFAGKTSETE